MGGAAFVVLFRIGARDSDLAQFSGHDCGRSKTANQAFVTTSSRQPLPHPADLLHGWDRKDADVIRSPCSSAPSA